MTNILSKYTVIDLNRINGVRRGIYRLRGGGGGGRRAPRARSRQESFTREEAIGISKGVRAGV